ncbi:MULTISPECIES: DegT/DnrJ/EryC1/StrS family aminotransferase [Amycolatopsis]|uniref:Pyridoxal phosphate-dependent aminotransferase n=1 Tax=Amycolatopsis bullii TaxID=941987 RepID=A0ABQ3KHB3_9PSEU|nr:DegT/DnrJ/EryC1/StrS family aminotransferase [Amycolatopsis bullii]GHG14335.1 pyridoxal phosphate-dependent aminotransferase [Amycolatopsis bullii]
MLAINGGTPVLDENAIAPWPEVTDADREAVLRALDRSTPWRWPMTDVQELEAAWAEHTGSRFAVAANSGTAALHMAVAATTIGPGDEVLVPADTFLASATCVLQANAVPVFVDVDPVTYTIDPSEIERHITPRTRAIIAVDLNGLPADYDALHAIARKHNLIIVEDGAQAHGATYRGRAVGSLGDLAGCSLNGSKCLSALSEGGLFTTNNEEWHQNALRVLMFGDEIRGKTRAYNARIMGWNYRLHSLAAAFARSQLERLPAMSEVRSENGNYLAKSLTDVPGVRPPTVPEGSTHVYFFFPLMVEPEALGLDVPVDAFRCAVKAAMRAEGVPLDEWQRMPVPGQTLFQEMRGYGRGCPWTCGHAAQGTRYDPDAYPVTRDICRRRLVLGSSTSSFGPPNGVDLMNGYAEAFHKVLVEHRAELAELTTRFATAH